MSGIEIDFQQLMEKVYGPHYGLGKRVEEESARIAKELVDNAEKKVKKMTETKQTPPDIIEIDGVKYQRVEEPPTLCQIKKGMKWWNDGKGNTKQSVECPGKEWNPGRGKLKQKS